MDIISILQLPSSFVAYLRQKKLKKMFATCGSQFTLGGGWIINTPRKIEIGNNVSIGPNVVLYSIYKKIIIGNNVLMGPHVTMVSGDHNIRTIGIPIINNHEKQIGDDADIIIEDEVWIGTNVTILKGVKVGRGCVVAAGAVLTTSFPPYSIIGGVPAKIIGKRFDIDQIREHEKHLYPKASMTPDDKLTWIEDFTNSNG